MAITRINNIGSSVGGGSGHLYNLIKYIMNPSKTENNLLIGGNSGGTVNEAYDTMMETKRRWDKTDKRQGYHIVISFPPGEATMEQAYQVLSEFCEEYLGDNYDYVFSVHTDTDHMHGHIAFNSVNRITGYKYRYENRDWEKFMQPVTDRICERHGLPKLVYDKAEKKGRSYAEHFADKQGLPIWKNIIRADIDFVIGKSGSMEEFFGLMKDLGYEIKQGKYITFLAPGGKRGHRDYKLGAGYTREDIEARILEQDKEYGFHPILSSRLQKIYDQGYEKYTREALSEYQLRHVNRFYRAGHFLEMRNPFLLNQREVRENAMHINELFEECEYITEQKIRSPEDLELRQKELSRKESALKNQRRTQYSIRELSDYDNLVRLQKKLEHTPEWDREYASLQQEIKTIESSLPEGMTTQQDDRKQIQEELKKVRQEKRLVERIMKREEETKENTRERTVDKSKENRDHVRSVYDII